MSWFKVDDSFSGHPKVLRIPRRDRATAIGLWTLAGSWCAQHLTDGHLERHMLEEFGSTTKYAAMLVDVGLWEATDTGFQFHDWADWQPTREQVKERRETEARRKQEWRDRKRNKASVPPGVPPGQTPDETPDVDGSPGNVRSTRPDPTRPDPTVLPTEVPREGASAPKRRSPERPLPHDWEPTNRHRKYATERGLNLDNEAFKFRSHADANDRRQRNWDAAFTTWLARAVDYTPGAGSGNGRHSTPPRFWQEASA